MRFKDRLDVNSFSMYVGTLGEDYVGRQTGTITGGLNTKREIVKGRLSSKTYADGIVRSLGNVIDEVKVGFDSNIGQATVFKEAIRSRKYKPGSFYFLLSPLTGKIGATQEIIRMITKAGFDIVKFEGEWWEFYQQ